MHIKINKYVIIPLLLQFIVMYKLLSLCKVQIFNLGKERTESQQALF
jgi:hypothetical protein